MMPISNKIRSVGYSEKMTMPPLGIISIGNYLKLHGYEVMYIDLFTTPMTRNKFTEKLLKFSPEFIGISTYTETYSTVIRLSEEIKSILPNVKILLGGPHVTFLPEEALSNTSIDYVSRKEGEVTIIELLEFLNYGTIAIGDISGLSYKRDQKIIHNKDRDFIINLDALPWGDMSLKELKMYSIDQTIITSRGCPGHCIYCASPALSGNKYRFRSAESVFSEIYYRYHKFNQDYFAFLDDTFTANKNRINKLCKYIKKSKLPIEWRCDSRTDILSEEMIDLIVASGCKSVHVGIESGVQNILNQIGKNINLEKSEQLISYMHKKGLQIMCSFIIGIIVILKRLSLKLLI